MQTAGRLVRLERQQGEYWVLTLMLAGLKTQWSPLRSRAGTSPTAIRSGFFADQLNDVLCELPAWLWAEKRRKRSYVNQVLARAELDSSYEPSRRLWVRARNGYYFPNPQMALRIGGSWQPVYEVLALDWIDKGCGRKIQHVQRPSESIEWVRRIVEWRLHGGTGDEPVADVEEQGP